MPAPPTPHPSVPDELTSPSLQQLIRKGVAMRLGEAFDPALDKTTMLRRLGDRAGPTAIIELGYSLKDLPPHPVLAVVEDGRTAVDVIERWIRLERFGHTNNRTRVRTTRTVDDRDHVTLEHIALDGSAIDPVNDLFIWGLMIALLTRAGVADIGAELIQPDARAVTLCAKSQIHLDAMPRQSHVLELSYRPRPLTATEHGPPPHDDSLLEALRRLFETDLLCRWRVGDAARALGRSKRQLQRSLTATNTSFSKTLQRCRVDAALRLMKTETMSLTEIAYCAGFSDSAHFTRLFRRYADVPPSALREVLTVDTAPHS